MSQTETKKSSWITNTGRMLGAIGAVLLISVPLTWGLSQEVAFQGLVTWKLILAFVCEAIYFLTNKESLKEKAGARSTLMWSMTLISSLIVLALVGVANYLAVSNDREWDLTRDKVFSLSDQTQSILSRLDQDVQVYAFFNRKEAAFNMIAREVFERYEALNKRFKYEIIDIEGSARETRMAEEYEIEEKGARVVLMAGDKTARARDLSEEAITNALIQVTQKTKKLVHVLTGHGELSFEDANSDFKAIAFAQAILKEGYDVELLNLINPNTITEEQLTVVVGDDSALPELVIPPEVRYLIIAGPRSALLAPELKALNQYLEAGGRAMVMMEPSSDGGMSEFLKQWRVELRDDMIVDPNPARRELGLSALEPVVLPAETGHPITKKLTHAAVMKTARTVGTAPGTSVVNVTPLLTANNTAWGETNLEDGVAGYDETDSPDNSVGLVVTRDIPRAPDNISSQARLIVFGDSDWATDEYFAVHANQDYLLNSLNWMADEEGSITIRPKMRQASRLSLTGTDMMYLKFFSLDVLPMCIVALGLGIVLIRRQK